MMANEEFEQFLEREARSYNTPPTPPVDAMWSRIEREVAVQRGGGRSVIPLRRRGPVWMLIGAIAAALVIGVLLGRLTVDGPRPASRIATLPAVKDSSVIAPLSAGTEEPRRMASGPTRVPHAPRSTSRSEVAEAETQSPGAEEVRRSELPYRVAAVQHLVATEALLTSVQASRRAGQPDSAVALWARDLLGTTRMLIDSPASDDPQMQRLLEDLELVLVQIAHLQPNTSQRDIDLIEQAIRQHDVMTRLRTATPSASLHSRT
jgi:hypothetical protein